VTGRERGLWGHSADTGAVAVAVAVSTGYH